VLLESTVAHLLKVSSNPLALSEPVCQSQDIAQVHAVNILRILVQDSSLVTAISQFYATLTMQALNGFMSPVWAMRNASLQLLGYICLHFLIHLYSCCHYCLQCFDTVGWESGRASGLYRIE